LNRGGLYANQEKLDLALADWKKAIVLNPNFALAYYNRGLVYKDHGKLDLALVDYNKAIALNPTAKLSLEDPDFRYINPKYLNL
jgi:tetratricopeptide (TPR) repeat protein